MQIVGARPSELGGRARKYRKEPVCLKCSKGLVNVNSESSSVCIEERARQCELWGGARLAEVQ